MKLKLPTEFNGSQFAAEIGLGIFDIWVENGDLYVNAPDSEKTKVQQMLDKHKPIAQIDYRASALAKLAALGLSADEIAAL